MGFRNLIAPSVCNRLRDSVTESSIKVIFVLQEDFDNMCVCILKDSLALCELCVLGEAAP